MNLTKAFANNILLRNKLNYTDTTSVVLKHYNINVNTLMTLSNPIVYLKQNIQTAFASSTDFFASCNLISNILDIVNSALPIRNEPISKKELFISSLELKELNLIEPFMDYYEFINGSQITNKLLILTKLEKYLLEIGTDVQQLKCVKNNLKYNSEYLSDSFYLLSDSRISFIELIGSEVKFGSEMSKIIDKLYIFIGKF